jgi:hypothetical protein
MLLRFVFRLGLGIVLITTFGVALIRAQRVEDTLLVSFLTRGCEEAVRVCWNGILPGSTRVDDAVALLESHPWIEQVTVERQPLMEYIYWNWNDRKPAFLDTSDERVPPFVWASQGVVDHIAIPTSLSHADILRKLGTPQLGTFRVLRTRRGARYPTLASIWHVAGYDDGLYLVYMTTLCPVSARNIWRSSVTLSLYSRVRVPLERYDLEHWLRHETCQV